MFLAVTIYFSIRAETVKKSMYENITEEFIADIKNNGIITVGDYEKYMERMGVGDNLFDFSYEHRYMIIEPEYRYKTLEEIISDQNSAYNGSNDYHYREVETERPPVDDPVSDENLNKETNESIMEKSIDTPADPNHVHGDNCYYGTKHIHTGNSKSGGGCYGQYTTESCKRTAYYSSHFDNTNTFSCNQEYVGDYVRCPGTVTYRSRNAHYDCGDGHRHTITIYSIYTCSYCGTYQSYIRSGGMPSSIECSQTVKGYKLNCGKTEGKYYDENGNETEPICDQIVSNITATHPEQTVYQDDPIITTARAVYLDGSERTVICTTDLTTDKIGSDIIGVLTYTYEVNGELHSKTCNIKVTIIPKNKTCPRGHVYNLSGDGSDPGCPYCSAWIESLKIIIPNTLPIIITIGTSLQDIGLVLQATYMDGHTEDVTSGYVDNLDKGYLGTMQVTIGYKGAYITVPVITVCATMICNICGYEYNLYPDGTNPGCPRCMQRIPVFTGDVIKYEHINNTEDILNKLYEKGQYSFNINDTFSVTVINKSSSLARMLLGKIYPSLSNRWFMINKSENIMSK